jgi:hypothetical protein
MRSEQLVAGDIAYNAPPPPPNAPPNPAQHGDQEAMIQHLIEPRQQVVNEEAFPPPRGYVPMILRGHRTNRIQRKRGREVFQAEHASPASPEYVNWSEQPIGLDRSDHTPKIPQPGHHALVLKAQIGGFTTKKVFMDGGSSLNLIYA